MNNPRKQLVKASKEGCHISVVPFFLNIKTKGVTAGFLPINFIPKVTIGDKHSEGGSTFIIVDSEIHFVEFE